MKARSLILEYIAIPLNESTYKSSTKLEQLGKDFNENPYRAGVDFRTYIAKGLATAFNRNGKRVTKEMADQILFLVIDALAPNVPYRGQKYQYMPRLDTFGTVIEDIVDRILLDRIKNPTAMSFHKAPAEIGFKLRRLLMSYVDESEGRNKIKDFIRGVSLGSEGHQSITKDEGDTNWLLSVARDDRESAKGKGWYTDRSQRKEVHELVKRFGITYKDMVEVGYDDISIMLRGWDYDKVKNLVDYLNSKLPEASAEHKDMYVMPDGSHNVVAMLYPDDDEDYEEEPMEFIY